jgi:hypothetical protein
MSTPWWDDGRSYGDGRTRGVRRPPGSQKKFNAWMVAFVAHLLARAVFLAVLFVVASVGLLSAPFVGLTGIADGATIDGVVMVMIVVTLAIAALSVAIQARYISRRGGVHALTACVIALVAGLVVGVLMGFVELPNVLVVVSIAVVEITIVALLIEPDSPQAGGYGFSR